MDTYGAGLDVPHDRELGIAEENSLCWIWRRTKYLAVRRGLFAVGMCET